MTAEHPDPLPADPLDVTRARPARKRPSFRRSALSATENKTIYRREDVISPAVLNIMAPVDYRDVTVSVDVLAAASSAFQACEGLLLLAESTDAAAAGVAFNPADGCLSTRFSTDDVSATDNTIVTLASVRTNRSQSNVSRSTSMHVVQRRLDDRPP